MKSHTVPKKLLEQFAYHHEPTNSMRLWRYQKGRAPYGKASLKTATMIEGHFSDPRDATKEEELEKRLNHEFEQPVNEYIHEVGFRTFWLSRTHQRQLTLYLLLLFNRSKARRLATRQQVDITVEATKSVLANDEKLTEIASKWTLDAIKKGISLERMVTKDDVFGAVTKMLEDQLSKDQLQHSYSGTVERAMSITDDGILNGEWNVLHTEPDDPFVIGDAPVATWERTDRGFLLYGQGFSKPDVEVFLPVSPIACLHIMPLVKRSRRIIKPTTLEINTAQAAFASDYCFTNRRLDGLSAALQPYFGTAKLGVTAFSIRHRDYGNALFNILMDK